MGYDQGEDIGCDGPMPVNLVGTHGLVTRSGSCLPRRQTILTMLTQTPGFMSCKRDRRGKTGIARAAHSFGNQKLNMICDSRFRQSTLIYYLFATRTYLKIV